MSIINVPRIVGVTPHCETGLNNAMCPYIAHGCDGCVPEYVKRWAGSFFGEQLREARKIAEDDGLTAEKVEETKEKMAEVLRKVEEGLFFDLSEAHGWPELRREEQKLLDVIIEKEVIS
jgi:hypothetical protein